MGNGIRCRVVAAGFALASMLPACTSLEGNGQPKIETRSVAAFDAITVANGVNVAITLAPDRAQSVQISGDSNFVDIVQTTITGSQLRVGLPPNANLAPRLPLRVTISAVTLSALTTQDSSVATASALAGDNVTLASKDSSSLTVGAVTATTGITISSSDSSTLSASGLASAPLTLTARDSVALTLSGEVPTLTATVSNSAELNAKALSSSAVSITTTDSVQASVCATGTLDATLSNSSRIAYWCNPGAVTQHVSDSASLAAN